MSDEDKKYLRRTGKMRPSLEIFERMVRILKDTQLNTDQLLSLSLSKNSEAI